MEPWREEFGVVPSGIVRDEDHRVSLAPVPDKLAKERLKGLGVEHRFLPRNQASISDAHGAEYADALAGGSMQHDGVNIFRRHPHGAA